MSPLILIVDNEPHVSQVMSRSLKHAGYEVDTARDGEEAMRKIDMKIPDVLIADTRIRYLSAQSLCEKAERKYPERIGLAVLMSASNNIKLREWALNRTNTQYFEKPVSQRRLVEHVKEHFESMAPVGLGR